MAWELRIYTIDVGQGDCSLIVARDTAAHGLSKTMLIDGGEAAFAPIVHRRVSDTLVSLGNIPLDNILLTHYHSDHMGALQTLLQAENLHRLCRYVAVKVSAAVAFGTNRPQQLALAAMTIRAIMIGVYDDPTFNPGYNADGALNGLRANLNAPNIPVDATDDDAIALGVNCAERYVFPARLQPPPGVSTRSLIPPTRQRGRLESSVAVAAADGVPNGLADQAAYQQALATIGSWVSNVPPIDTGGLYGNARLIDNGNDPGRGKAPELEYQRTVDAAAFRLSNGNVFRAPGFEWDRNVPALGRETLWTTPPARPPAGAPTAFVTSVSGKARGLTGSVDVNGGQADNDASISIVVRFNDFFYYTGGDLPSEGEDPIAASTRSRGFIDPTQDGNVSLDPATRIAAFKCGHHGSQHSTSQTFLQTATPVAAMVSCGRNQFGDGDNHPTQATVDRLHLDPNIENFYLTNCYYTTIHIPASNEQDQIAPGNKSRVGGDEQGDYTGPDANKDYLLTPRPGRVRGDIFLWVRENRSMRPGSRFYVIYQDYDDSRGVTRENLTHKY